MRQTDKISTRVLARVSTRSAPNNRLEEREDDVRTADIVMALGGCWVLLAVVVYMTLTAMTAHAYPGDYSGATVTLMPSVSSEQIN